MIKYSFKEARKTKRARKVTQNDKLNKKKEMQWWSIKAKDQVGCFWGHGCMKPWLGASLTDGWLRAGTMLVHTGCMRPWLGASLTDGWSRAGTTLVHMGYMRAQMAAGAYWWVAKSWHHAGTHGVHEDTAGCKAYWWLAKVWQHIGTEWCAVIPCSGE